MDTNTFAENVQSSYILLLTACIALVFLLYVIYLTRLNASECSTMNNLYSSLDGYIRPIGKDEQCSYKLFDYYVKTAFNACSGGSLKNDFVNICNVKAILKQGVRCLDFEIYSVGEQPVVATSTTNNYHVKETLNYVTFAEVMKTLQNYAFSGGTCPNPTDPLLLHLRIQSARPELYTQLADIFSAYDDRMLGKEYSFENAGTNLGTIPLLTFQNKIIVIVDKTNPAFLENAAFLEYVNLTSNSIFMRALPYFDVKNSPDLNELTEYNKRNMTIVFPDTGANPANPSGLFCRSVGCQMVAMRYQLVDNMLMENAGFFDKSGYAFALKPEQLRYKEVTVPTPTPQNPAYSYGTRKVSSDYYNFDM